MYRLFFLLIRLGLYLVLFFSIFIPYLFYVAFYNLPNHRELKDHQHIGITKIYDVNGNVIAEYAMEKRIFVPIDRIPKKVIEAFLSSEDKNFYQHQGIDFWGLARLPIINILKLLSKKRMQGASTITQQVVKNLLLTNEYSVMRKVKEAILSYKISQELSKDEVLELYLNHTYLGRGSYGVAAAAKIYFNKSLNDLSIAEMAFLASLPKAPSILSNPKNYFRAIERKNYVIDQMVANEFLSPSDGEKIKQEEIIYAVNTNLKPGGTGYFAEAVREEVIRIFGEDAFYNRSLSIFTSLNPYYQNQAEEILKINIDKYEQQKNPIVFDHVNSVEDFAKYKYTNNSQILCMVKSVTPGVIKVIDKNKREIIFEFENAFDEGTIDTNCEKVGFFRDKICAKSFKDLLKPNDLILVEKSRIDNDIFSLTLPKDDNKRLENLKIVSKNRLNGGIIVMNYEDGRVLGMVGGYSFLESKFNRATQANRQIGSLIKIFIYLSALEHNIEPSALFSDQPMEIVVGNQVWKPKNYGDKFLGNITMQESFEQSRNLSTLRIVQKIGLNSLAEILKRFNIHPNPPKFLPVALGAIESTLLRVATAVGSIANDGRRVEPSLIDTIKDQNGKIIYLRDNQKCIDCNQNTLTPHLINLKGEQIADLASTYQIQSLMNSTIEFGNANKVKKQVPNMTLAGKTGTTNESRDVWFAGFSKMPKVVFTAYLGYDSPKTLGKKSTGNSMVTPMFGQFMEYVYNDEIKKYSKQSILNRKNESSKHAKLKSEELKSGSDKNSDHRNRLAIPILSPESYKLVYMNGRMCMKIKDSYYQYGGYYPKFSYLQGKVFNQSIFNVENGPQNYNNKLPSTLNHIKIQEDTFESEIDGYVENFETNFVTNEQTRQSDFTNSTNNFSPNLKHQAEILEILDYEEDIEN